MWMRGRERVARWGLKAAFVWQLAERTLTFTVRCVLHTDTHCRYCTSLEELWGDVWQKKKKIPLQIYKKPSLSPSAVNGHLRAIKRLLCFHISVLDAKRRLIFSFTAPQLYLLQFNWSLKSSIASSPVSCSQFLMLSQKDYSRSERTS